MKQKTKINEIIKKYDKVLTITIIVIIILIILIRAFINMDPINGKMICTYKTESDKLKSTYKYNIEFKFRKVTYLETYEVITSEDEELLKEYKESLEMLSSIYENLKYYNNDIKLKNNSLTTKTKINYSKLDMTEYKKLNPNNPLIKNNKISIKDIKKVYERNGAKCTYK